MTILHEMAHMWFGDLVTMRWWDDLWLNESFAEWAAALCQAEATRWTDAWTTFANFEKTWAYRQDQLPSTHPIATDAPDVQTAEVNFDGITYAKGACVLKQLAAYVGVDAFLAGLRDYFAEHAYGNTTLADLLGALERASGRDLGVWSKLWLETTGINTFSPGVHPRRRRPLHQLRDPAERAQRGRHHQHAASAPARDRAVLRRVDGQLVRTKRVELDVVGERTSVDAADRRGPARGAAAQRRRPDLLQGPPRRAQHRDAAQRRHRHVRRHAARARWPGRPPGT